MSQIHTTLKRNWDSPGIKSLYPLSSVNKVQFFWQVNSSTGSSAVRKQPCFQNVRAGDLLTIHIHWKMATGNRISKCWKTWSPATFITSHKPNLLIFLHDYKLKIITQYFQLQNKKRDESWWRALIFLGLRAEPFIVTGQQHCCKMERSNAQLYLDKIKQKTNTPPPPKMTKQNQVPKSLHISSHSTPCSSTKD